MRSSLLSLGTSPEANNPGDIAASLTSAIAVAMVVDEATLEVPSPGGGWRK
jgi:hypothetical protein